MLRSDMDAMTARWLELNRMGEGDPRRRSPKWRILARQSGSDGDLESWSIEKVVSFSSPFDCGVASPFAGLREHRIRKDWHSVRW